MAQALATGQADQAQALMNSCPVSERQQLLKRLLLHPQRPLFALSQASLVPDCLAALRAMRADRRCARLHAVIDALLCRWGEPPLAGAPHGQDQRLAEHLAGLQSSAEALRKLGWEIDLDQAQATPIDAQAAWCEQAWRCLGDFIRLAARVPALQALANAACDAGLALLAQGPGSASAPVDFSLGRQAPGAEPLAEGRRSAAPDSAPALPPGGRDFVLGSLQALLSCGSVAPLRDLLARVERTGLGDLAHDAGFWQAVDGLLARDMPGVWLALQRWRPQTSWADCVVRLEQGMAQLRAPEQALEWLKALALQLKNAPPDGFADAVHGEDAGKARRESLQRLVHALGARLPHMGSLSAVPCPTPLVRVAQWLWLIEAMARNPDTVHAPTLDFFLAQNPGVEGWLHLLPPPQARAIVPPTVAPPQPSLAQAVRLLGACSSDLRARLVAALPLASLLSMDAVPAMNLVPWLVQTDRFDELLENPREFPDPSGDDWLRSGPQLATLSALAAQALLKVGQAAHLLARLFVGAGDRTAVAGALALLAQHPKNSAALLAATLDRLQEARPYSSKMVANFDALPALLHWIERVGREAPGEAPRLHKHLLMRVAERVASGTVFPDKLWSLLGRWLSEQGWPSPAIEATGLLDKLPKHCGPGTQAFKELATAWLGARQAMAWYDPGAAQGPAFEAMERALQDTRHFLKTKAPKAVKEPIDVPADWTLV